MMFGGCKRNKQDYIALDGTNLILRFLVNEHEKIDYILKYPYNI